ncbi:MAG TPA: type III-B CRISPR module-associated protein Cmr5 [Sulfurimonas sp. UBA12504]|nr:MAG TPA: type III-B CRISPR module-associated protein Cmr5 [Sulfurimonas sp. UBA12504]
MAIKDLAKERSQFAYQKVEEASKQSFKKDYKTYVKKIPMMVLTNGLGATFAFVYSKKKDGNAYDLIFKQTAQWLQQNENDFMKWIIDQESPEYRATTNEILALFQWLKRFADRMIEGEENGEEKE